MKKTDGSILRQLCVAFLLLPLAACAQHQPDIRNTTAFKAMEPAKENVSGKRDTATFAAGCFWCVEAQFQQLEGVDTVISGFTGGTVANPSYKAVCTGTTGHAEACNIIYDPSRISYDELLAAFFTAHDPTQLNRQGNDVGTQYRSAIFYHNEAQKEKAGYYIKRLNEEHAYNRPIVTEVAPYTVFYKAEDYHQDYYNQNGDQPYCQLVIRPKLEKFKKVFKDKLKH
ncbi:peptide-methionine (S)-S-oxide reductase MsrA [Chitinophaga japonensis]|uniref:Peptide methionine sulfoxide reductase MsrA n=1 Tax=Chitinophaga japonensis TaxID=104662 RepID=A0A562T0M2_CHIJA|nr:peptide-methionine (S)-S-oxide reductase MsrA [Chitinophaga japonensis]TWI86804.1 peptide-methionine (S)-S-oxide reductase [Chitinophaga japonensis]